MALVKVLTPSQTHAAKGTTSFSSTAELALSDGQGLPKIGVTHGRPSPRKSLVKGERLIRHEERPEYFYPTHAATRKASSHAGKPLDGAPTSTLAMGSSAKHPAEGGGWLGCDFMT